MERSKNNINFLIAEIIYDIKSGKMDLEKKINNLAKLGKDSNRITALCNFIKYGKRFNPTEKSSFEKEIVEHERLISLI